jgi:hypothetical protein
MLNNKKGKLQGLPFLFHLCNKNKIFDIYFVLRSICTKFAPE